MAEDGTPTDAGAQPPGGQDAGASGSGNAPWAHYLDNIPEQVRGDVEPAFKEMEANFTRKFQEASEYRKAWEPYEQLGVNQVDPQEVDWLMQFRGLLNDPQAVQAWFAQYANETGLTPQEQQEQDAGLTDPDLQSALERMLEERLGPVTQGLGALTEWQAQQEENARMSAAKEAIETQLSTLKEKHGDFPRDQVEKFVANYIESDPEHAVERAHADWLAFVSDIEKRTLAAKLGQPPGAESGGSAAGQAEPVKTLKEAGELARAQLREAMNRAAT